MKRFQVFAILGGIVLVIGVFFLLGSFGGSSTSNFTLPAGQDYYYYMKFAAFSGEHLTVQFTADLGSLDAYVLDESAYTRYEYDLVVTSSLDSASGSSGTLDVTFPVSANYYVVFDHGFGYNGDAQPVQVRTQTSGVNVVNLGLGAGLVAVGAALEVASTRMRKKEAPRPPPGMMPTDVTMFGPPQPPTPPLSPPPQGP